MLTELAEQVQPQPQAARAWAKARQVRRRRAVIGATVAVLLVSATITLYRPADRSTAPVQTPSPTPSPTATGTAKIHRLPATIPADNESSPYWPETLAPPVDAPPASQLPFNNTVLLFQPNSEGPIYAYGYRSGGSGSGFQWVRLDVPLTTRETQAATGRHPST